jgi:hypothetical protein
MHIEKNSINFFEVNGIDRKEIFNYNAISMNMIKILPGQSFLRIGGAFRNVFGNSSLTNSKS